MPGCTSANYQNSPTPPTRPNAIPELRGINGWPSSFVYDQGNLGSDTSNSMAFTIKYLSIIDGDGEINYNKTTRLDISRLFQYWNSRYLESRIMPDSGVNVDKDTDTTLASAMLAMKYFGACPENINVKIISIKSPFLSGDYVYKGWPYSDNSTQFKKQPDQMSYFFAETENIDMINLEPGDANGNLITRNLYGRLRVVFDYIDISSQFKKSNYKTENTASEKLMFLNAIKNALYNNNPIVIGLVLDDSFDNAKITGVVPMPNISLFKAKGGHSFVIVGYGKYVANSQSNYFKCINSWGMWGDKGFVYFPEEYITNVNIFDVEAFATRFTSRL